MASIFRKSYTKIVKGKRVTRYARKYTIKYKDEHGQWRTKTGTTDKGLTQRMAATVEYEVDQRRGGHGNPYEAPRQEPLSEHLEAYRRFLEAKERCPDHVERTICRIQAIFTACGFTKIEHLAAYNATDKVGQFLTRKRKATGKKKIGNCTSNYYLTAIGAFCRWATRQQRMPPSPIAFMEKLNTEVDDPRSRRIINHKQFEALLAAAERGPATHKLPGIDRAWVYTIAAYTGLRASELAGLTAKSFKLDSDPPGITVRALTTKNRENVHQPLPEELVKPLKQWLRDRDPDKRLWPGGWNRRAAEMLRVDLEAVGIPFETEDGVFDFHSLRVSYVTNLVKSGANPKIVQTLARHSTIVLTMDLYAKQDAKEAADALKGLPSIRRRRRRA
jgi:integrase